MRNSSRTILSILAVGLALVIGAASLSGCATVTPRSAYASEPPPSDQPEAVPDRPGPGYAWAPGHWTWQSDAKRFTWVPGEWLLIRHPHHTRWVAGHWAQTPKGYRWMPGHWR